jgi:hypothetical protein
LTRRSSGVLPGKSGVLREHVGAREPVTIPV